MDMVTLLELRKDGVESLKAPGTMEPSRADHRCAKLACSFLAQEDPHLGGYCCWRCHVSVCVSDRFEKGKACVHKLASLRASAQRAPGAWRTRDVCGPVRCDVFLHSGRRDTPKASPASLSDRRHRGDRGGHGQSGAPSHRHRRPKPCGGGGGMPCRR